MVRGDAGRRFEAGRRTAHLLALFLLASAAIAAVLRRRA